jgi:N-methylhydantoinase A/oxoprolinase/acetone carboxylase beta subunit
VAILGIDVGGTFTDAVLLGNSLWAALRVETPGGGGFGTPGGDA